MELTKDRVDINRVTDKIIGCVHRVSNTLGSGFLEKVYENALAWNWRTRASKYAGNTPSRFSIAMQSLVTSAPICLLKNRSS